MWPPVEDERAAIGPTLESKANLLPAIEHARSGRDATVETVVQIEDAFSALTRPASAAPEGRFCSTRTAASLACVDRNNASTS